MAGIGTRSKIYTTTNDIVAIPATVAAGVTIVGKVLYPFESSGWGNARIVYATGDTAKVGDTVVLKTYVSFDLGDTWDQVHEDSISDTATTPTTFTIPFAPRVRIDLVADSAGSLSAGHGITVDVEFQEDDPEAQRTFTIINTGDTLYAASSGDSIFFGSVITINTPSKVSIFATADDLSKITNVIDYKLTSSLDGTVWFPQSTLGTAKPVNGTGIAELAVEEETTNLSKYLRLSAWDNDGNAVLTSGHGIKFYIRTQE